MNARRPLTLFAGLVWAGLGLGAQAQAAHVNVIELDNRIINPVTQQYITDAIERSETDGAVCLVVLLDTPGGLLESTRAIVKRMMNARVPVAVYVAPSGSRAGSAGVFLTLAGHIAAMAPSTNIGAAHPVDVGGGGPMKKLIRRIKREVQEDAKAPPTRQGGRRAEEEIVEEEERDPLAEKVLNDTIAWVTTIARARGRNVEWAAKAVRESVSVTETEAVAEHIVDLIAMDVADLLAQVEGRTVELAGMPVELHTKDAEPVTLPMSKRQEFLAVLTNPNIAYLLMLLGTLGLIFEFTHPGIGFPGIAGLICLLLALYAFQTLPVSYAAVALLVLGIGLLIAEVKILSHGLLAVGGVIALTLGSLMLFESPDPNLQVSLHVILPAVVSLAAIILFVLQRALRAQARPVATGAQGLVGEIGVASSDLAPDGKVFVHGELWNASSPQPIRSGERVRVVRVDGLHLHVAPVSDTGKATRNLTGI
ncbi:MAG: nodulation protein NfeD [Candidatus Omnitrophica bacterium]|nr:nodulation protein NfeD [Candidatus Omnitrophota bacterium]